MSWDNSGGGGYGGRGGGGGGGSRACYNCNEEGHISRDCPQSRGGGGGGGGGGNRGCFNCGESGHMSRECPNQRSGGGGGGRGGGGGGGGGHDYESGEKTSIKIPSSEVGRVIGRGGSTIRDLQDKSGARIKVGRESYNDQHDVDIFGSEPEREAARDLISQIIDRSQDNYL